MQSYVRDSLVMTIFGGTPQIQKNIIAGQLGLDDRALGEAFWTWGVVPERITSGNGLETLITSQFLHSGFWQTQNSLCKDLDNDPDVIQV